MTPSRNIMIGTPCYGGMLTAVYVQSLARLVAQVNQLAAPGESHAGLVLRTHQDSLITRARNSIVASFLDDPQLTHLLFIDADTGFDTQQIKRMLDFDQDIVAGIYPVKQLDWSRIAKAAAGAPTAEQLEVSGLQFVGVACSLSERENHMGFVTAQYAGTGFMLIRRSALVRLAAAYPETKYRSAHINEPPSDNRYNLFDCVVNPDSGVYLSEDYTFCQRWRKLGGKVWLDTLGKLKHVGTYEFEGKSALDLVKR